MSKTNRFIKIIVALIIVAGILFSMVPQNVKAEQEVSGVLSKSEITLTAGDSIKLKVVYLEKGSTVTWKSSKKSVAKVNSKGTVTAKKKGMAEITAIIRNGSRSEEQKCIVTVNAANDKKTVIKIKENSTVKTLKKGKEAAVDVHYFVPSITIKDNKAATETINAYFKAEKASWYSSAKEACKDWVKPEYEIGWSGAYSYEMNYNTVYHNGNLLSLDYYWYCMTNGPHPWHGVTAQAFDLSTGEQILLKDIVKNEDEAVKYIYENVISQFKENADYSDVVMYEDYKEALKYYPLDGKWNIIDDNMEVTFSAGEITYYAEGTMTALISLTDIAPFLNEYGMALLCGGEQ